MSRPLTDADRVSIVKQLTGGWNGVFNDAVDIFDRANFVAGTEDRSPLATVVRSLTRLNCRRWARADKENFSTGVNLANSNICGKYLDSINENPLDGGINIPFTPAQCPVAYNVQVNFFDNGQPFGSPNQRNGILGPLSIVKEVTGFSQSVRLFAGNGIVIDSISGPVASNPTLTISNVVRVDGLPDDCGLGSPEIAQPSIPVGLPALPPTTQINLPGLGPVDVSLTLNPDGSFQVCIAQLDTCFSVDPTTQTPIPSESIPGDIGDAGDPEDAEDGQDAEGDAPEDKVIGGLKLNILAAPQTAKLFSGEVFRGACYVYMGTLDGLRHHPDGSMLIDGQLVLPEKDNLTKWKVTANSGYSIRVIPFYKDV